MNDQEGSVVQWSRGVKYSAVIVLVVAFLWLFIMARELVNSLIIAAIIAYLLKPIVDGFQRIPQLTHNVAVYLTYLLFLALAVLVPASVAPTLTLRLGRFIADLESVEQEALELVAMPIAFGDRELLPAGWAQDLFQPLGALQPFSIRGSVDLLSSIGENFIWVLVILVSVFYLLRDGPRLRDWSIGLTPSGWHPDARQVIDDIDRVWRRYLRGQVILGIIVGAATGLALNAIGMRQAVTLGLIAGLLDLIPSLGPMVAGTIATVVALIGGSPELPLSNFWFAILVLSIFLLIQQIENIWLRPQLMGQTLRIHPGLIFIGVFGALATFGVLGALIVIPIMGSLAVLGRYAHPRIMGLPVPPPPVKGRGRTVPESTDEVRDMDSNRAGASAGQSRPRPGADATALTAPAASSSPSHSPEDSPADVA